MDVIKQQLQIQYKVCLGLDGVTSTNKQAIMSVIAYYMDQNWALREVQLTFDEIERMFGSRFESELKMIG
jgi:hypothetical protein